MEREPDRHIQRPSNFLYDNVRPCLRRNRKDAYARRPLLLVHFDCSVAINDTRCYLLRCCVRRKLPPKYMQTDSARGTCIFHVHCYLVFIFYGGVWCDRWHISILWQGRHRDHSRRRLR